MTTHYVSDDYLLEFLFCSEIIRWNDIFGIAVSKGEIGIMHRLFDRGVIHYSHAACGAAEIGDVKLIDQILRNWDLYGKKYTYYYVSLESLLKNIIRNACKNNCVNVIEYLIEQQDIWLIGNDDQKVYLQSLLEFGLAESTSLELAQYFVLKGATNYDDCVFQACCIGDLDMLKYSLSMYQATCQEEKRKQQGLFEECITQVMKGEYFSLLEYLVPYCCDLTDELIYALKGITDSSRPFQHKERQHCCYVMVQAINQDIGLFDFNSQDFNSQEMGLYDVNSQDLSRENIVSLFNYGLSHEILQKIEPHFFHAMVTHHKIKCKQLQHDFHFVMPNDVFSILKQFIVYDMLPLDLVSFYE